MEITSNRFSATPFGRRYAAVLRPAHAILQLRKRHVCFQGSCSSCDSVTARRQYGHRRSIYAVRQRHHAA